MAPLNDALRQFSADCTHFAVAETFLFVRIYHGETLRRKLPNHAWVPIFSRFYQFVEQNAVNHGGALAQIVTDGALTHFLSGEDALRAAIDLQESFAALAEATENAIVRCAIGIATGEAFCLTSGDNACLALLGTPVEIAQRLCEGAAPGVILLANSTFLAADLTHVSSTAGRRRQRPTLGYFLEQPLKILPGLQETVELHSLFWQDDHEREHAEKPYAAPKAHRRLEDQFQEEWGPQQRLFGRVSTLKQDRGFGFIQYFTEGNEYREVYFHIAYVIDRAAIKEGDTVEFIIKPGKGGRPQACSILVMGGRIQGQVEFYDHEKGAGTLTIRDQDSDVIPFHIFSQEVRDTDIKGNDIVEFTVTSGSESEGLVALDVRLFGGRKTSPHVGSGDNLRIGHTEQAVITTYSTEKGYGFAKCRRNSIYVHVSELVDMEQTPKPGDIIEFEVSPGRNGTYRATDVRLANRKHDVAQTETEEGSE